MQRNMMYLVLPAGHGGRIIRQGWEMPLTAEFAIVGRLMEGAYLY